MEKIVKTTIAGLQRELMMFVQMGCGADLKLCLQRAEMSMIKQLKLLEPPPKPVPSRVVVALPEFEILKRTKDMLIGKMELLVDGPLPADIKISQLDELAEYVHQIDEQMQCQLKVTDLETRMFDSSFDSIKSIALEKPTNFIEKNKKVMGGKVEKTETKAKRGFQDIVIQEPERIMF